MIRTHYHPRLLVRHRTFERKRIIIEKKIDQESSVRKKEEREREGATRERKREIES